MILSKRARNEDLRMDYFQKSTRSSGVHPMNHHLKSRQCQLLKHRARSKTRLTSNKVQVENKNDF
jgi:hypothetical protein